MLMNTLFEKVYLACGSTDMRKSIDGLAAIVTECFDLDPFSTSSCTSLSLITKEFFPS